MCVSHGMTVAPSPVLEVLALKLFTSSVNFMFACDKVKVLCVNNVSASSKFFHPLNPAEISSTYYN